MSYSVYKHTFPNNKVYIGTTCQDPEIRWNNGMGYVGQRHMIKAIIEYGWDNIKHEILLKDLTKEEAEQKEIELISYYKSNQKEHGYNMQNGGNLAKQTCTKANANCDELILKSVDLLIISKIDELEKTVGKCCITNEQFSKILGESISTIKRSLNKLEALNIIKRNTEFVHGNGRANKQRIINVNSKSEWNI